MFHRLGVIPTRPCSGQTLLPVEQEEHKALHRHTSARLGATAYLQEDLKNREVNAGRKLDEENIDGPQKKRSMFKDMHVI